MPAEFVTVTFPVTARDETFAFIWVSVQVVTVDVDVESTFCPVANVIKLVDVLEEPNAVPVMVTKLKADVLSPDAGFGVIDVMLGIRVIVSDATE